ncbi:MAG: hypothetical protein H6622_00450 [Halobacteriovoraceae bacterium]|nr:hypothetical protein [Halobacteriovoraceae bacterium]
MNIILEIILLLSLPIIILAEECPINLRSDEDIDIIKARNVYLEDKAPGVRFVFNGLKGFNTSVGQGSADDFTKPIMNKLCEVLEAEGNAENKFKYKILDLDYKGVFITCTPMSSCLQNLYDHRDEAGNLLRKSPLSIISDSVNEVTSFHYNKKFVPEKPREIVKNPLLNGFGVFLTKKLKSYTEDKNFDRNKVNFSMNYAGGSSYPESYINARAKFEYPNYKEPVADFLKEEYKRAEEELRRNGIKLDLKNEQFLADLDKMIDLYRKGYPLEDLKGFGPFIKIYDIFFEIPYKSATSLANTLQLLLTSKPQKVFKNGYSVEKITSGDDMYIVIKKDGVPVNVLGGDARGLGKLNIISRAIRHQENLNINNIDDLFKTADDALDDANLLMGESLDKFYDIVKKLIEGLENDNVELALEKSYSIYLKEQRNNPDLMMIRAGLISEGLENNKSVQNRLSTLFNLLKDLEEYGYGTFLGKSCLSLEYFKEYFYQKKKIGFNFRLMTEYFSCL